MRKLIIALLILALPSLACAGPQQIRQVVGMAQVQGGVCDSTSDVKIITSPSEGGTGQVLGSLARAYRFTLSSSKSVTGIYAEVYDDGLTVSVTGEIYTDSSGLPGTRYSATTTATVANPPNSAGTQTEFIFPSSVSLPAGTYHAVIIPAGDVYIANEPAGSGSTGEWSADIPPWGDVTQYNHYYLIGVMGCN